MAEEEDRKESQVEDRNIYLMEEIQQRIKSEKANFKTLKEHLNEIFISDEKQKTYLEDTKFNINEISKDNLKSNPRLNDIFKYFTFELTALYEQSKELRMKDDEFSTFLVEYTNMPEKVEVDYLRSRSGQTLVDFEANKRKDFKKFFLLYLNTNMRYHANCVEILTRAFNRIKEDTPEIDVERLLTGFTDEEGKKFLHDRCGMDIDLLKEKEKYVQAKRQEERASKASRVYDTYK